MCCLNKFVDHGRARARCEWMSMSLHLKGWIFSLPIASTYISRAIPYLSNNSSSSPTHTFWAVSPMTVLAHKVFYFDTSSQSKLYGRNHHTIDIVPRVRWWLGLLSYNIWVLWYSFVSPQGRENLEGRKSSNLLYSFQYIVRLIRGRNLEFPLSTIPSKYAVSRTGLHYSFQYNWFEGKIRFFALYYSYSLPLREVQREKSIDFSLESIKLENVEYLCFRGKEKKGK